MYIDVRRIPSFLRLKKRVVASVTRGKIAGLRTYFRNSGYGKAVIGLSGGIDSAVSLALAARALGAENVFAFMLPYEKLNDKSMMIAEEVARSVGLPRGNLLTIDITKTVRTAWESALCGRRGRLVLRLGNMAARQRMIYLMDAASALDALVVGTENRTEHAIAYYTIGGDNISNFEPFLDLWKTQVFQVGEWLKLPASVLDRAPSAELWEGQTDEKELEVPYSVIDTVLAGTYDEGMTTEEIVERCGIALADAEKVLAHVKKMRGKRECPFQLGVPDHAFLEF